MFAINISNSDGNCNRLTSTNLLVKRLKELGIVGNMSLSFWFRDFTYAHGHGDDEAEAFANRNVTSSVAYVLNMLLMGFPDNMVHIVYGSFMERAWSRCLGSKETNKERKAWANHLFLRTVGLLAWL